MNVVPTTYADSGDLAAWTQTAAPSNALVLLRAASSLVYDATNSTIYDADPLTGFPTDPEVLRAHREATCIQAAMWDSLGINPLAGGVATPKVVQSKQLGSGRIVYADAEQAAKARSAVIDDLCSAAARRLDQAGLLDATVWTFG